MSRKKRNKVNNSQQIITTSPIVTLESIEEQQKQLDIQKNLLVEKGLRSDDPSTLLRTYNYLNIKNDNSNLKSFIFNPDLVNLNSNNFRTPFKRVSYDTLRRMTRTPIIKTIIGTRVDQVSGFSEVVFSKQDKGWMIRKKKSLFDETNNELSDVDKRKIEEITKFIVNGGSTDNKWSFDSFDEYLRQIVYDSLSIDQICMECVFSRGGKLVEYYPIDGSTIRLTDLSDESRIAQNFKKVNGYYPKYVQVWQDQIYAHYYPWEMMFGVRNKSTDINNNGYGVSELEDMINIVTWLLFGMQYNGNFFSQGSNPKGFFTVEGNLPPNALNDFKQMWRNTISGVQNAWKVPVIESGQNKVNWINMQGSNKDMEFDNWLEFLIVVSCCVFKIDPTECGFNLKKAAQIFGQDGQKERLKHSQSKGLVPILKLIQRLITKYIVEQLDENYEFVFCGMEVEDQSMALDMDVKKIQNGLMSLEDGFKKYSGRDFDPEKDTLLNQVWLQMKQAQQMGGDQMNQMVDSMETEESDNPFENMSPFEKSLTKYIEQGL